MTFNFYKYSLKLMIRNSDVFLNKNIQQYLLQIYWSLDLELYFFLNVLLVVLNVAYYFVQTFEIINFISYSFLV